MSIGTTPQKAHTCVLAGTTINASRGGDGIPGATEQKARLRSSIGLARLRFGQSSGIGAS